MSIELPAPQSISLTRNTHHVHEGTVTRAGAVVDISGMTVFVTVVRRIGRAAVMSSAAEITASIPVGSDGKFLLTILAANNTLPPGNYYYQVHIQDTGGLVSLVAHGPWNVFADIR